MAGRSGLLVRIEDASGCYGWGEIWCNFPPRANLHRKHILQELIAPELIGRNFAKIREVRAVLEQRWEKMALHVGEPGPFSHCIAGIDAALWDMEARRADVPLAQYLADNPSEKVRVYASTLPPENTDQVALKFLNKGHKAFKLKVGSDQKRDVEIVRNVRDAVGADAKIMVDANQSWTTVQAVDAITQLSEYDLSFVEEPIMADTPANDWKWLSEHVQVPLAAGENICSANEYEQHLSAQALTYYQPDIAKWGGVGGCADVGRQIVNHGHVYCPHFMGTAIGLASSFHLLAAVGGEGFVELDSNENPLRTELTNLDLKVENGFVKLADGAGIGVEPDPDQLARFTFN